jgi:two-component system, LuxR family, response regulator FixJ
VTLLSQSLSTQTIFLVDDDSSVGEALVDLLELAGFNVKLFDSAESFLAEWMPEMAGCLLLDVRLPGLSGLELQARLAETKRSIPIIIMTGHGDVPMVRKALKAGAIDFLAKPFQDDDLLRAVEQALAADRARRQSESLMISIAARFAALNDRERQVMELVTDGLMNKEIAAELLLSPNTVKVYRKQVMDKMQADSVAELVRMRQKLGMENLNRP